MGIGSNYNEQIINSHRNIFDIGIKNKAKQSKSPNNGQICLPFFSKSSTIALFSRKIKPISKCQYLPTKTIWRRFALTASKSLHFEFQISKPKRQTSEAQVNLFQNTILRRVFFSEVFLYIYISIRN
jgi:hypothetical protein